ncbi:MAG: four helix bundle protein [Planctomycetaceae bacterium]
MENGGIRVSIYRKHTDLPVYKAAFEAAMEVFAVSKQFPREETYSLTDQIRRSSRSVCANIAEAWRKRRSAPFFVSTLNIAEAEAAECQVWLQFAVKCEYLPVEVSRDLYRKYDEILSQIVHLIRNPDPYILPPDPPDQ